MPGGISGAIPGEISGVTLGGIPGIVTVKIMREEFLQRYFWRLPWMILEGFNGEISGEIPEGIHKGNFYEESR